MLRILTLVLATGCVTAFVPLSDDVSNVPPTQAIELGMDQLAHAYAFTAHKAIDWPSLRKLRRSEMEAAQSNVEIDQVFRRLVTDLPDGHVELWNDDPARDACPEVAATFGFVARDLDDGTVMVVSLDPDGPGFDAGIEIGDRILAVDERPIEMVVPEQPLHCVPIGLATLERRRAARVRLLSHALLDTTRSFELARNGKARVVQVVAEPETRALRDIVDMPIPEARVTARIERDDVGHIAIGWEATAQSDREVRQALKRLWREGARYLVVDLRDNQGGTDQTAANIVGMFTDQTLFYDAISMYDRRIEGQRIVSTVFVEPQEVRWDAPVVVLVNGNTVSSGDGMARMFKQLGIPIVGFEATAASFGSGGSTIRFPGGWTLLYPAGRGLDEDGSILIDSDATLQGGITPTHRIPWTADHQIGRAQDRHGFALAYAIDHVLEER
ncbi:MAG: S41 family peptidase [Myxococcota bacterium]